jgi:carbon-monoxide dehydrogenase small subunit
MKVEQKIVIPRPVDAVWAMLSDVPAVVKCIPGAQLGESLGDDVFRGTFNLKIGPLSAKIEGEGKVQRDDATRSGTIEGKGVDRRGGSRVSAVMSYAVVEVPDGSQVNIAADLNLAGQLSQIGRTGLIEDVAKRLTEDFSVALTERLTAASHEPDAGLQAEESTFDAGKVLRQSLWKRLKSLLARVFGG